MRKKSTFWILTFTLAAQLALLPEARAEWERFSENELGDIFFYDKNSVKKDAYVMVWVLINYQKPVKVEKSVIQSAKIMIQLFCKDNVIRSLASFEYSGFNGQGKLVRSSESNDAWASIRQESPEKDIAQILCEN